MARAGRGRLYVVATPIGNLGDITQRAIETLGAVDVVVRRGHAPSRAGCSRTTGSRRSSPPCTSTTSAKRRASSCGYLEEGRDVALVTDAGTPAISRSRARTRSRRRARPGSASCPFPGRARAIAALSAAGVPGPFAFAGFLPAKPSARRKALAIVARLPAYIGVLRGAPSHPRVRRRPARACSGPIARVVIARELTKAFETVARVPLGGGARLARGRSRPDARRVRRDRARARQRRTSARTAEGERVLAAAARRAAGEDGGAARRGAHRRSRNELYALALAIKKAPSPPWSKRRKGRKAGEG